jgi:uncharacterized Zn-binding protein involved in type VI secretion
MARGATRALQDTAGGTIIGGASTVLVNGFPISVMGDSVVGHGENQHKAASMIVGSSTVLANGLPVVRAGDPASCGHIALGSSNVLIG